MSKLQHIIIGIFLLFASMAQAGDKIYLKSKTVETQSQQFELVESHQQHWIVQFESHSQSGNQMIIEWAEGEILAYLAEDAYVIKADQDTVSNLSNVPGVRAILPFKAEYKISHLTPHPSVFMEDAKLPFEVKVFERALANETEDLIKMDLQGQILSSDGTWLRVIIPINKVPLLAENRNVMWIEPVAKIEMAYIPFSPEQSPIAKDYKNLTGYEAGTRSIQMDQAWSRGFMGQGQIVAVADTGLDTGEMKSMSPDFPQVLKGYILGYFSKSWNDPHGHGTHVAGSVLGTGSVSGGMLKGAAHQASLVVQGTYSPILKGPSFPAKLKDLFAPTYKDGARIHSNSWGTPRDPGAYDAMAAQVDEYMWENEDFLIVFAAGNSGVDNDKDGRIDEGSMLSPATAKNTMSVGASENYLLKGGIQRPLGQLAGGKPWSVEPLKSDTLSNDANGIAAFSSRGPTKDGRLKPDVVAPGTNIVSVCSSVNGASNLWGEYNKNYCYSGGTSMSTPLVAGAAAVAREYLQKEWNMNSPSAALIKGLLMHTADDLYPGQYGAKGKKGGQELLNPGPNVSQGYGRVNMDAATSKNDGSYIYALVDDRNGVADGKLVEVFNKNGVSSKIKVTLVYTDAPAAPNASKTLVNDLDLIVIDTKNNQSLESVSRVNNSEQVTMDCTQGCDLKIQVKGHSIPKGKAGGQPFAVVVSTDS